MADEDDLALARALQKQDEHDAALARALDGAPASSVYRKGTATALQMGRRGTACVHASDGGGSSSHARSKRAQERVMLNHELLTLAPTLRRLLSDKLPDTRCSYRIARRDDVDAKAAAYHATMLDEVMRAQRVLLVPLTTTGDGSCLLHALSRAMWGVELFSDVLRMDICAELEDHREWYVERVGEEELGAALAQALTRNAWLSNLHALAAAHVLRRPVVIYASLEEQGALGTGFWGVAGVFAPLRLPPSAVFAHPVCVGWQSERKDHFVAIVPSGKRAVRWPEPSCGGGGVSVAGQGLPRGSEGA